MIEGIRTIIYPVKDIAQAKTLYSKLLGVKGEATGKFATPLLL